MEGNDKNTNKTPGDRVRTIRKALGLTQEKFAEKLEVNAVNYISMLETGVRDLPVDLAKKIAALLPPTRFEWIMCFDDFQTDDDRLSSIINGRYEINDLIERLMILHGYRVGTEEVTPNIESLSNSGKQEYEQMSYKEVKYYLQHPHGMRRFISYNEMSALFSEIFEFVYFKCWTYFQDPFSDHIHTRKRED